MVGVADGGCIVSAGVGRSVGAFVGGRVAAFKESSNNATLVTCEIVDEIPPLFITSKISALISVWT